MKKEETSSGPNTASADVRAPAERKWYDRIGLRGYTQFRWDQPLDGEAEALRAPGDRFIGDNQSFGIRRARLILSGDLSEHVSLYFQPDFASTPTGSTTGNFAQLRDLYADIYFDKAKEYRLRAGQSKIPYGFENLQSSQNRLAPDRADALNSAVRDERDVGLLAYYSPKVAAHRFRDLVKNGLKGSGDYGVVGFGVYNGQGANRVEANDDVHTALHLAYPFQIGQKQIVEFGMDAYTGFYKVTTGTITANGASFTPNTAAAPKGYLDQRVAAHFVIYPQPFGLQGEWTYGRGPELDLGQRTILQKKSLSGGYLQAMYRTNSSLGWLTPYAKLQTYSGASKFDTNAPAFNVNELELGVEWQVWPELELTTAYSNMRRTNVTAAPYPIVDGNLLRLQLQWNY